MPSRIARVRVGSLATFAALAVAAALLDLGRIHALEHGDSIVPVLVSLQRWTPFYWDQERYGMLIPLLAVPVRDPLWNLLLQRGLLVLAGLAAVVLLARHVVAGRDWRLAGALAAATLLLSWPARWSFEFLGDQPYGLSLALALAGLAFAEPPGGAGEDAPAAVASGVASASRRPARLAAALLLLVVAHWVNAAVGVFLLPLAVARAAADRLDGAPRRAVRERLAVEGVLLGAGLVAGQGLLRLYPVLTGNPLRLALAPVPVSAWPRAWGTLLERAVREGGAWPTVVVAIAAVGGILLALPRFQPLARAALVRAALLGAAALAYALFTGTLGWVRDNGYHWRYLAPSAVVLHVAAVSLVAEPLARALGRGRLVLGAAVALVPIAALAVSGPPSLAGVRRDLDAVAGRWTADVLAARCALVAGDYWSVWPAVFHATLVARERGLPADVHGVTHRATPTVGAWKDRPRASLRICRVRGAEAEGDRWLRLFHLWPATQVERRPTVDVLVPVGEGDAPEHGDAANGGGRGGPASRRAGAAP